MEIFLAKPLSGEMLPFDTGRTAHNRKPYYHNLSRSSSTYNKALRISTNTHSRFATLFFQSKIVFLRLWLGFPTAVFCDNNSAIALTKNPVFHGRSKHIRIKYHFIRELIKDGEVNVKYCKTQDQEEDVFTKALKKDSFVKFKEKLGVLPSPA